MRKFITREIAKEAVELAKSKNKFDELSSNRYEIGKTSFLGHIKSFVNSKISNIAYESIKAALGEYNKFRIDRQSKDPRYWMIGDTDIELVLQDNGTDIVYAVQGEEGSRLSVGLHFPENMGDLKLAASDQFMHFPSDPIRYTQEIIHAIAYLVGEYIPQYIDEPTGATKEKPKFVIPEIPKAEKGNMIQDPLTKKWLHKDTTPEQLESIRRNHEIFLDKERQKNDPNYGTMNLYPPREKWWEAEIANKLVKLANRLDELGMSDIADDLEYLFRS